MERRKVAMVSNVVLESTSLGVQQSLESVDFILELTTVADAQTGFLSLFVNTFSVVAGTPAASRLCAVAFYLSVFAELAAANQLSVDAHEAEGCA
jgi:hypothetical protein